MKFSLINRIAFRSMFSHRQLYAPYLLATSLLFALESIIISLLQNKYIFDFHPSLRIIISMGVTISTILILVIALYTCSTIRQSHTKEFGLYAILGLEKKHIRRIIFIQTSFSWLATSVLSIVLGYLAGSLMFVALNRLMRDTGAGLMDYPFQNETAIVTVTLIFITCAINFVTFAIKIGRLNPMEQLRSTHQGQSEPQGRWWMTLIGLAALAAGYYMALTTGDVLGSLQKVFAAILLVIIGTYFLFISLSITILKGLRRNKEFYYKPVNFLSTSGMLHRMNNNAVSLATIAILCSGIILVLGITLTLYRTMETQIKGSMPYEYEVSLADAYADPAKNQVALEQVVIEAASYGELADVNIRTTLLTPAYLQNVELVPLPLLDSPEYELLDRSGQQVVVLTETLDSYNAYTQSTETLDAGEVLIASNLLNLDRLSTLAVNGQSYQVKSAKLNAIPSNFGIEVVYVAFRDAADIEQLRSHYLTSNSQMEYVVSPYSTSLTFNVDTNQEAVSAFLDQLADKGTITFEAREQVQQMMYSIFGGLLFIGLVIGAVLLIGTILLLYFKQISEGWQDRENYRIMKQVGLPDQLIRKTIKSQILWTFVLPVAVAAIHNLFASKIMYALIGLFGSRDPLVFTSSYFGVLAVFILVYLLFYRLTSHAYYNIVND